ncbi:MULTISPECIES: hypothetical protein [unclassified Nocardia]|uniref:hypothetical protein n=1 Tax=unclassified Nocardia TaxID=2637762 RepID=UPI00278C50DB|nr:MULTISPECIES: hypothetical protein [unclassified Nocardia]
MTRSLTVLVAGLLAATTIGIARADEPLPGQPLDSGHAYLFTQQHQDNLHWWNGTWMPQTIPTGAHIQIQLPSDPTRWTPVSGPECRPSALGEDLAITTDAPPATSELLGGHTLPNTARMEGSSAITVFDYRAHGFGLTAICLRPDRQPDPGRPRAPAGDYVLTLVVGVPQAGLP